TRSSRGAPLSQRRVISAGVRSALLLGGGEGVDVRDDQRARSLIREYLAENPLRSLVRDDVNASHSTTDSILDGLGLWKHTVGDPTFFSKALEAAHVGVRDERARVLNVAEDARRTGAKNQLLRRKGSTDRGGHRVGIDVQQHAAFVR